MTAEMLPPFSLACSMKPGEIVRLMQMIASHSAFTGIEVGVNTDRKTYSPFQVDKIPQDSALVQLAIPRDTCMPYFFGELVAALNAAPSRAV